MSGYVDNRNINRPTDQSVNAANSQSLTLAGYQAKNTLDQRKDYTEVKDVQNSAFGQGSSGQVSGRDNTLVQDSRDQTTLGGSGLTLGTGSALTIATDQGSLDVAREISLAALDGSAAYVQDMRHFVESNQGLARSIAEGAFAVAADAPPPDTTRRALWIGGGLVALALLLSAIGGFGRKPKKSK